MPRTTVVYEFGRLNFITMHEIDTSFLLSGLTTREPIEARESLWSFFDVELVEVDEEPFIAGYLVKFERQIAEEVVDEVHHRLTTTSIPNAVRAKSRFILDPASHIIAFHPSANEISSHAFRDRFTELFDAAHGNFFVQSEIQTIQEEGALLDTLPRFQNIAKVEIVLHPSNPSNRERWKQVDERLRALHAARYKETYTTPIDREGAGIRAADDSEITAKVAMAEDGYGEAEVTGVLEGRVQTVSTASQPVTAAMPSDEQQPEVRDLVKIAREVLRRIIRRFNP